MSQKRPNDQNLSQQEKKSKLNITMEGTSFQSQESNLEFVIMPWDDNTEIFFSEPDGQGETVTKAITRWELIKVQLDESKPIYDIQMFIDVIRSYNVMYNKDGKQIKPPWKCMILRHLFDSIDDNERYEFFKENGMLSRIRHLALGLKDIMSELRLLKTGTKSRNTLHQLEIASLLANAFMCTFPKREADCPSINFNTLFEGGGGNHVAEFYVEKLKCIIHYFKRVTNKQPIGKVTFQRLYIPDNKFPRWDKTKAELCDLHVETEGRIEEQEGYLQMDFANRYVGGGVLGRGCVQEEIRFIICPELIIARLFTECLTDNEALLVIGVERFCNYTGYSDTFEYDGDYKDNTPFDDKEHRKTYLIVLDALYFHHPSEQYRESKILRELKKAYVGFKPLDEKNTLPIATGNWGCGAFRGDPQLKSILQLMAASQARRNLLYLTFGDVELKNQMEELYKFLRGRGINVGFLYRIIRTYKIERRKNQTVYDFIKEEICCPRPQPQPQPQPQSNPFQSASTSKFNKPLFVKKEPLKKLESDALFDDEFTMAEKTSVLKIKNDIAKIKKCKTIEKQIEELDMDYDYLQKRIKRQSTPPPKINTGLMGLEEEEKRLLELYTAHPIAEKTDLPKPSVWFENEITSHTKKVEKPRENELDKDLPSTLAESFTTDPQFEDLEKMNIDNSLEEQVNEETPSLIKNSDQKGTNLLRPSSPSLISGCLERHEHLSEKLSAPEQTVVDNQFFRENSPDIIDNSIEINTSDELNFLKTSKENCDSEELVIKEPVKPESLVQMENKAPIKKYSQIKITDCFFKK